MHLGKPVVYKVTKNFMKMFGISSLDDLPELPRYKLDENEQIVIDEVLTEKSEKSKESEEARVSDNIINDSNISSQIYEKESDKKVIEDKNNKDIEAPMPV